MPASDLEDVLYWNNGNENGTNVVDGLMDLILDMRMTARANKDWGTSDKIRDTLKELGVQVKDGKDGSSWSLN